MLSRVSPVYEYQRKSGMVVVINNEKWIGDPSSNRDGTDADLTKIKKTFESMKYDVRPEMKDLKATEMKEYFKNLGNAMNTGILSPPDIFICFILSHGSEKGIEGVDQEHVALHELAQLLESDKCAGLKGKPKLFFIQACRGKNAPDQVKLDSRHIEEDQTVLDGGGKIKAIPPGADFFFGYSTLQHNVALRKTVSGAHYIQILCNAIEKHGQKLNLYDIMMLVHQKLATDDDYVYENDGKTYRQMAEMVSTLRGHIFFPIKK